ncbi:MAG TPA: efflux RND transporter periplasmic adaptor subunit [Alphaproteobacteria bacterium]|nr:efflux RND transporter periplasmic adaptor subunit [Alphaproteobacteria bacterium]
MRKTILIGGTAVIAVLVAGIFGGDVLLSRSAAQQKAPEKSSIEATPRTAPGTPVEAAPVEVSTVRETITVIGSLRSNESVIVRPEITGRITEIHFEEGQRVKQGDLLFSLDRDVLEASLREARASLAASRRDYERADELLKKGAGTARQRDDALGKLEIDQARLALAQARLERTRITAPFGGIVGLRQVSIGDYVSPGQDLVNLENIDPIKVEFRVPEVYLRLLKVGMKLTVTVDALPGETFEGEVYAIDPRFDAAGRSVALRATIPNPDSRLRPGLFARVEMIAAERPQAILIPEQAIMPRGEQQFVYRVIDGKAEMTRVTLGIRRRGQVEVTDGLSPGDVVVSAGHQKLREGTPVAVMPPARG